MMLMPLRMDYVVTIVINKLVSTIRNIDNNSIDATLNHLFSIVCPYVIPRVKLHAVKECFFKQCIVTTC